MVCLSPSALPMGGVGGNEEDFCDLLNQKLIESILRGMRTMARLESMIPTSFATSSAFA